MDVGVDERVALRVERRVPDEPAIELDEPGLASQIELAPFVEQVGGLHLGSAGELRLEGADELRGLGCVVLPRRTDLHAATSSSSVSGEPGEIGQLARRLRLGRLVEAVDPDRAQAELVRRRDVVEEARRNVDVPSRGAPVCSKNRSQWRWPGL